MTGLAHAAEGQTVNMHDAVDVGVPGVGEKPRRY